MKENPRPLYATGSGPTRASSPRQLPTDQDYAVPTREYQTDQSSQKLPRPLRALPSKQLQQQQQNPRVHRRLDTVTPYQSGSCIGVSCPSHLSRAKTARRRWGTRACRSERHSEKYMPLNRTQYEEGTSTLEPA
jgi:hypothetical protein